MLGLVFLLLTLAAFSTQLLLSLSSIMGVFLIWKWKMRGFLFSFLILASSILIFHKEDQLLMVSSIVLSWIIMTLSLQLMKEQENEKRMQSDQEIEKSKEELLHAVNVHRKETKALNEQIEELKKEVVVLYSRLEKSESKIAFQRDELNELRVEAYQLSIFRDNPLPPKIIEVIDHRDIQLRKQFEEKSQVLQETRKTLFYTENTLLSLQKEQTSQNQDLNEEIKLLVEQCLECQCEAFEEEIEDLHAIIATLSTPKRGRKTKKQEAFQASLF